MKFRDIPVPDIYKSSADFRTFLNWFSECLTKLQDDIENITDLIDPERCPKDLLWLLAETMGFRYEEKMLPAYNRLVLLYFMSMIYNRGSRTGMLLAAETNLAQFNINDYADENEAYADRLADTSIPVNSVYLSEHPDKGYIDLVYYSEREPIDVCIEYVRPVGMYCFKHSGVRVDARTKISIDAKLTDSNYMEMAVGPTRVGHYRRADYASIQKMVDNQGRPDIPRRRDVWYRNSEYEGTPTVNAGYRSLASLQLCNNEHIVKSLLPSQSMDKYSIFSVGYEPSDVSVTVPNDYLKIKDGRPYNLRYDEQAEAEMGVDIYTIDEDRTIDIMNPRPAINIPMMQIGDAISLTPDNTEYTKIDDQGEITIVHTGPESAAFFSHSSVPLNSLNYAGQYYLLVPDANGNMIDAVQQDKNHCTFEPALGTAFTTVGETIVTIKYHREYVVNNETIVVDTTCSQTINVVDHGTVTKAATSSILNDIYSDGYCFWRPYGANAALNSNYINQSGRNFTKSSAIPWRATRFSCRYATNLTDISELANCNTSNITSLADCFNGCYNLADISALHDWDVSNVTTMQGLFATCKFTDTTALENWNTSKVTTLEECFKNCTKLADLSGLSNWNTSAVTQLHSTFQSTKITNLDALANWDVRNVIYAHYCFDSCTSLTDISGLLNWNTAKIGNITYLFNGCYNLSSLHGLENWDVSRCATLDSVFACGSYDTGFTNVDALANWDVSNVAFFTNVFGSNALLSDISGLARWNTVKGRNFGSMFRYCKNLTSLHGMENWNMGTAQYMQYTFSGCTSLSDISAVASWDVSKVTDMRNLFENCSAIKSISAVTSWVTTSLQSASLLFHWCYSLESLTGLENWDVSHVTTFNAAFQQCNKIDSIAPLSNWQVLDSADLFHMFYMDSAFSGDASPAQNWGITTSGKQAFDGHWSNVPSWN